jgi:hypothetical protein
MKNIKKVAAGVIAGAAITTAPLVAFAAPAFADTGSATPVTAMKEGHIQPAFKTKSFSAESGVVRYVKRLSAERNNGTDVLVNSAAPNTHVLVNSAAPETKETHVLVNAASAGSLRDGNAARCGGGISC